MVKRQMFKSDHVLAKCVRFLGRARRAVSGRPDEVTSASPSCRTPPPFWGQLCGVHPRVGLYYGVMVIM